MSSGSRVWADYQAGVDAYNDRNFKKALEEWLPLAEGGDAVAQNSVGALYDHGLGVEENDEEAVRWYQAAADQDMPLAMRNLGNMYAGGHGVPFDQGQADYWYQKAAEAGDPVAMKRVGMSAPPTPQTAEAPAAVEPMQVEPDTELEAAPVQAEVEAPAPASAAEAPAETPEQPAPEAVPTEPVAEAPAEAPPTPADADQPAQYGDTGTPTAEPEAAPAPAPSSVQQASVAPTAPSDPENWLIGTWQGPALGCPPGGGLEFAPGETRSYYQGRIAATLKAKYTVDGDVVTVVTTGVDGIGHAYEYQQTSPSTFVIKAVPPEMPASMVGIEHRRCGVAPAAPTQQAAAPPPEPAPAPESAPAPEPAPAPEAAPVPAVEPAPVPEPAPAPVEAAPAEPAQPTRSAAAAPGSAQEGWDAFGRGDYDAALGIWKPLAEQGDVNMQLLVGSIYDLGQGVPQDDTEAVKWYEMAAKTGSAKGQYQLGAVYARSAQVKDPFQAYKWLTIAARTIGDGGAQGGVTADQATTLRHLVELELSKDDVAKAAAEAKAFKVGG